MREHLYKKFGWFSIHVNGIFRLRGDYVMCSSSITWSWTTLYSGRDRTQDNWVLQHKLFIHMLRAVVVVLSYAAPCEKKKKAIGPFLSSWETSVFWQCIPLARDKLAALTKLSVYPASLSQWVTLAKLPSTRCLHDLLIALVTNEKTKHLFNVLGWQLKTGRTA